MERVKQERNGHVSRMRVERRAMGIERRSEKSSGSHVIGRKKPALAESAVAVKGKVGQ